MANEKTNTNKTQDNDPNSWKNRELGGLWRSKTGNGFSGSIKNKSGEEIRIIIFPNKYKEEGNPEHSKYPDFRIYKDLPREASTPVAKSTSKTEKSKKQEKPANSEPEENEDFI